MDPGSEAVSLDAARRLALERRWADLAMLEPVKDYKARHASTLLIFDAVERAIAAIEARRAGPAPVEAAQ